MQGPLALALLLGAPGPGPAPAQPQASGPVPVVAFAPQTLTFPGEPLALVLAPFDGDAVPDLVALDYAGPIASLELRLTVLRGTGAGTFARAWQGSYGFPEPCTTNGDDPTLRAYDINADGWLDLVVPSMQYTEDVLPGDGSLAFGHSAWVGTLGGCDMDTAFPDFDGDGLLDSATAVDDGDLWLDTSFNQGHFTFYTESTYGLPGPKPPRMRLTHADLDGDGSDYDFIVTTPSYLRVFGWAGKGPTITVPVQQFAGSFGDALPLDLDGDGDWDLVASQPEASRLALFENLGGGVFQVSHALPTGPTPMSLAAGDFDGDGHTDVAVAHRGDDTLAVWIGDGGGSLALAAVVPTGAGPRDLVAADLELDGDVDLVTADGVGRTLTIHVNQRVP